MNYNISIINNKANLIALGNDAVTKRGVTTQTEEPSDYDIGVYYYYPTPWFSIFLIVLGVALLIIPWLVVFITIVIFGKNRNEIKCRVCGTKNKYNEKTEVQYCKKCGCVLDYTDIKSKKH